MELLHAYAEIWQKRSEADKDLSEDERRMILFAYKAISRDIAIMTSMQAEAGGQGSVAAPESRDRQCAS